MKIVVAYVFPTAAGRAYNGLARRFTDSYIANPPGKTDHELLVVVNGPPPNKAQEKCFDPLVPSYIQHNNQGKDIGAFQFVSSVVPCDLLVCIGSPARPRFDGWLDHMVDAFLRNGPGLYGCWAFSTPSLHVRTTVFWISPELFNAYPDTVHDGNRYEFEHGKKSITLWCLKSGFRVCQVTARGAFDISNWHHVEQKDCLFLDQHTDRIGWAT